MATERIRLREAGPADLETMHRVVSSAAELGELRLEIAAAGGYDLDSIRGYWERAQLDPLRQLLVIVEPQRDETVGILDFVAASPTDGIPWIGLVLIHSDHRRRGLGSKR